MQSQDEFNSLCLIVCSIFRRDAMQNIVFCVFRCRDTMHRVFTATNHHLVYFFIRIFGCGVAFAVLPNLRYGGLFVVWIWNLRFEGRVVWLDCLKNLIFVS